MIDDGQLFRLMCQVRDLGGLVTLHAENGDLITSLVARFQKKENRARVARARIRLSGG